ncbi:hypothetical protein RB620_27160 [Paenibacillus sp. LHD-117]|uniref:hypothetical protein n=1 Tax=Paenibacillus sp. LHD-117 TaxID=3071412 RepID=UPI0027E0FBBA|nr:hypothetical protein [Paenibacillus sp. LHD-117]MDQ6423115.1 hypothetical protein [Paenibacillus sp. LHD-117]
MSIVGLNGSLPPRNLPGPPITIPSGLGPLASTKVDHTKYLPVPSSPSNSTTTTSTSGSTTYQKPSQAELNSQLEAAKKEWWDARFRNDEKAMEAAKAKGNTLRQAGAVETEAAKKLDIENSAKWEALKQNELNANLFASKKQWWDAYDSGNEQGMKDAKAKGELYRSMGAVETDEMRRYDAERLKQSEAKKQEQARETERQKQQQLNSQLLQVKVQWWEARLQSGNRPAEIANLDAIKKKGDELRAQGAQDTAESDAVNRRYQTLLDEKLSGEKALLQEKKSWWNAYLNLDQAGMNKAASAAEKLRGNRYVKETAEMERLETQNQQFLRAKQDYYTQQMNLNTSGMSEAKARMEKTIQNGASLSSQAVYGMDTANRTIIGHRVAYWNTNAAEGWNKAEQHKYAEQTYRNNHAFKSLLISDNRSTAFDQVANDIIWKTADKWDRYATLSRNELSMQSAQQSTVGKVLTYTGMNKYESSNNTGVNPKGGSVSPSYNTGINPKDGSVLPVSTVTQHVSLSSSEAELQDLYKSMHTALSGFGLFRETKTDVVNKELEQLRKRYWGAIDTGNTAAANVEKTQIDQLLKTNQGLDGLLVSTKQEANNKAFLSLRDAFNADLSKSLYDSAISKLTELQKMLTQNGSDLSIRRNASVSAASADGLLLHIKAKEWKNAENLISDAGGTLGKVKATVKDKLGITQAGMDAAVAMDNANRQVLAAKRDFWVSVTNGASSAQLDQAYKNIGTAAADRNSTLTANLDTEFNKIFRNAIEYKIRSWTERGNTDQQDEVYALGKNVNALVTKANNLGLSDSVKGFSFGAGESGTTKLDQQLSTLYDYKKTIWDMDAGVIAPNDNTRLPTNPKQTIENLLTAANKYIARDLTLPEFAMDAANEKVLQARNKVLEAVVEGVRTKADYYMNEGRKNVAQGATLEIDKLVGDLDKLMNRSAAESMNAAINQRINQVNVTIADTDMAALQKSLAKMNIYEGPITGRYDKGTFVAVFAYQKLLESDARASMFKQDGVDLGKEGMVTKELVKFAITDTGLGRKNSPTNDLSFLREQVTYFGIADGMVTQLAEDAYSSLETVAALNPMSAGFWTKTVPQLTELAKGIMNGEITINSLFGAMAGAVKQEYVEPFQYLINNYAKVSGGQASYEEARTYGKNLTKAVEAIAGAITLSYPIVAKAVAKATPKVKELIDGIKNALGNSPADAKEIKDEVVGGGIGEIDEIIKKGKQITHFLNPADPFRDVFGAGSISHPEEWNRLIDELKNNGVEVVYREGSMGYGPLKKGEPGQILIDPEASMSALRHEYSHFLEAKTKNFPSAAESYRDWEARIDDELKAYTIEIEEAKRLGLDNVAKQLQKNFEEEKQYIIDRFKPRDE